MDDAFIFLATAIGGFAFAGVLLLRTELGSLLHRATGEIEELVPSVQRTVDEMESEITALHCAIDELRDEIKSIRAAANPSVESPRAGADLTSPAPAASSAEREEQRRRYAASDQHIQQLRADLGTLESLIAMLEPDQVLDRASLEGGYKQVSEELLRCEVDRFIRNHDKMVDRAAERMAASDEDDGA